MARLAVAVFLLLFSVSFAFAQSDPAAGIQPFSTNQFGVDLATGNVNVTIRHAQRRANCRSPAHLSAIITSSSPAVNGR
jgi:hypothetical protein